MNRRGLALPLMIGGLFLLLLAMVLPPLLSGRLSWNDTLARQLQTASQNYHHALHARAESGGGEGGPLQAARRAYLEQRGALEAGPRRAKLAGKVLRWAGILVLAGGVWLHFNGRSRDGKGAL